MLYKIAKENILDSRRIEIKSAYDLGLSEKNIEDFISSRLSEIVSEEQLMLIGQERAFQEEADLLALDANGNLYIFEIKKWQSNQENILQVMRYGQIFGRCCYEQIEKIAQKHYKGNITSSLSEFHKKYFDLDNELPKSKFNQDQVFVLVTNGFDADTISAINYWAKKGVKIECAPYRIYEINGEPYIQFDTYNPGGEVLSETNLDYFIVNTNLTFMSDAWKDMVGDGHKGKAAAYYDRKGSIRNIHKGSFVYLYHTGVGVIAKGKATSDFKTTDFEGDEEAEFFIPLDFDWCYPQESQWHKHAPKASEINTEYQSGYRFRSTVFAISQEMAGIIDNIKKRKAEE
jgi:hypothetical protein